MGIKDIFSLDTSSVGRGEETLGSLGELDIVVLLSVGVVSVALNSIQLQLLKNSTITPVISSVRIFQYKYITHFVNRSKTIFFPTFLRQNRLGTD